MEPEKETARIPLSLEKPMKATVRLTTAPPTAIPPAEIFRSAPLPVASPAPRGLVDSIPTAVCWALLSVSVLALLIQLWTYFS
jgi:hypothetical protein